MGARKKKSTKKSNGTMSIGSFIRVGTFPAGEVAGLGALTFKYRAMSQMDWSDYVSEGKIVNKKDSVQIAGRKIFELHSEVMMKHLVSWDLGDSDNPGKVHKITRDILAVLPQKVFVFIANTLLSQETGIGAESGKN